MPRLWPSDYTGLLENVLFEQEAAFIQTLCKCIIFNNLFQNLKEDKDEQNKKDQSPKNSPSKSNLTPKLAGKRLVSILNPKDVTSKQPTNEQEDKHDAEQERHENDEKSSEKFANHASDKNKKGSKSTTDTQSIETVMESEDNIGNDEDDSPSKTPDKTVDSIFPIDQTIELTKCNDAKCGCNAVHCPFCAPNRFKPTMPSRVRDHLENKHFSHAVQYEGMWSNTKAMLADISKIQDNLSDIRSGNLKKTVWPKENLSDRIKT